MAQAVSWVFNGISPALGAYKITNKSSVYGTPTVDTDMGVPPESPVYDGVPNLNFREDTMTYKDLGMPNKGYNITQVESSTVISDIHSGNFNNKKHGF